MIKEGYVNRAYRRYSFGTMVIFMLFAMGLASASVNLTNVNVNVNYLPGDTISGKINISFTNESISSILRSNFKGNTSVLDFLINNSLQEIKDYNCTTVKCESDYAIASEIDTSSGTGSFEILEGRSKVIGFKIVSPDRVAGISFVNLTITTNAIPSCFKQMVLEILGNSDLSLQSSQYGEVCEFYHRGSFNEGLSDVSYSNFIVGKTGYCEKMTLPPAPAYAIGARLNKSSGVESEMKAYLYREDGSSASCILPSVTSDFAQVSCVVNYSSRSVQEYYVCVADTGDSRGYSIRIERSGNMSGITQDRMGELNSTVDYDIFARTMQFTNFGASINTSLAGYINDYIASKYDGYCSKGCIIPFKFNSGQNMTVNVANVKLTYLESGGIPSPINTIYLLNNVQPKVNSRMTELDLSKAGFVIPFNSTDSILKLFLNDVQFGNSTPLNITRGFYFDMSPRFSLIGTDSVFKLTSTEEIVSASWKFSDGTSDTSQGNSITHRFGASNTYSVDVEAQSKSGKTSRRVFEVLVGNPKDSANYLIGRYEKRINNLSAQMGVYAAWLSNEIDKKLKIQDLNMSVVRFKEAYAQSTTNEQFTKLVDDLLALKIPYAVSSSSIITAPMLVSLESIDPTGILTISGKTEITESQKTSTRNAIMGWENDFYNPDVSIETISLYYEDTISDLFTRVKVSGAPKQAEVHDVYLVLNYPLDAIRFAESYSEKAIGMNSYINVGTTNNFEFLLPGKVGIENLGVYVTPDTKTLESYQTEITPASQSSNWGIATIWVLVIIVLALIAYIIMQEWYKRKYESYLFKNPQDLYNVINFIYNSRSSGIVDEDIRKRLSGNGWKKEQITYAFNKIDGNRTGMYEIPLLKFIDNKKVKTEIENRQKKPVDARFIKGNYLGTK